jgi:hypothetical protein
VDAHALRKRGWSISPLSELAAERTAVLGRRKCRSVVAHMRGALQRFAAESAGWTAEYVRGGSCLFGRRASGA